MREPWQEPHNPGEPSTTAAEMNAAEAIKPMMDRFVERKAERKSLGNPLSPEVEDEVTLLATRVADGVEKKSSAIEHKRAAATALATESKIEGRLGHLKDQLRIDEETKAYIKKINKKRQGRWYKFTTKEIDQLPPVDEQLVRDLVEYVGTIHLEDLFDIKTETGKFAVQLQHVGEEINDAICEELDYSDSHTNFRRFGNENFVWGVYTTASGARGIADAPQHIERKIGRCIAQIGQGELEPMYRLLSLMRYSKPEKFVISEAVDLLNRFMPRLRENPALNEEVSHLDDMLARKGIEYSGESLLYVAMPRAKNGKK